MGRYWYSLVRCVPEPATGEFINIGAIAGSSDEGDWAVRQIDNLRRAAKLCGPAQLGAVTEFLTSATAQIADAEESLFPLAEGWLDGFSSEMRNVVQLSRPQVAVGQSANEVLDRVFAFQLIDPELAARGFTTKLKLVSRLRKQLRASIADEYIVERPRLTVGDHVTAQIDFAFGADRAVQLTQAWTFQKDTVDDVARDVKAWGYAVRRLRDGDPCRLNATDRSLLLGDEVPIEVVLAAPITAHQQDVYEEASEIFAELDAKVYTDENATPVVEHITKLLAA
jgi:Protein of unknown function (DUF3037)